MPRSEATLHKRKKALTSRLQEHLDLLIGSVVTYQLKCSKHCQCNQGKGHKGFYLSIKQDGKTRNLWLPKDRVKQARRMSRSYARLKQILKDLSQVNYELLRAAGRAQDSPSP